MGNRKRLEALLEIGRLPSSEVADATGFPLAEFDRLLQAFGTPVDDETALALIALSPPAGESCHEVEWAIVHLVETYSENPRYTDEAYKILLENAAEGEVKDILKIRFENYWARKNKTGG